MCRISELELACKDTGICIERLREIVADVIKDMKENGEEVPQAIAGKKYSGKFIIRVPPEVHRNLAIQAAEAGGSINRLVSSRLSQ